jgi:hypothetical protein
MYTSGNSAKLGNTGYLPNAHSGFNPMAFLLPNLDQMPALTPY